MKILTVLNIAFLVALVVAAGLFLTCRRGKVINGTDWTAKRYGATYIVSIKNGVELVAALNDFVKQNRIKLGSVSGIGAVNEATLRFFNPATKQYVDKTFSGQMEITNLTGNISTQDGKEYTHFHITLGNDNYNALAGHLLSARLNGAGEFVVTAVPNGRLERTFAPEIGLNFYDFTK